jgi:4-hydroxybenzoate polyprenyltransferase
MPITDIRFDIINRLPPAAQPYALLMRLDRPIGWWLLLLPGWWSITLAGGGIGGFEFRDWYLLILFWVGAVAMRGAGCIVNDFWDRDLDSKVERTKSRPLAAGTIPLWKAGIFLGCLCFIGLFVLVQTSVLTFWLGIFSVVLIVLYPLMKRWTWWPQAFLGITFNMGVPMGWAAVEHGLALPALLLYIGAFFWTLGYDTIYAHQDKDDDQMVGIKSTALLFGERSKFWVSGFYALAWFFVSLAAYLAGAGVISLGLLLLPAVHLGLQIMLWREDDPSSSLKVFRSNRDCGLLFFLSFLFYGL